MQNATGHSSIRTTMGYVHLVDDDLSALVRPTSPTRVVDLKAAAAG